MTGRGGTHIDPGALPPGYTIDTALWDDPEVLELRAIMGKEVMPLYEGVDLSKQRVAPLTADAILAHRVVRHAGRIVASALLARSGEFTEVKRVIVHPDHRRRNLARALLDALAGVAAQLGVSEIVLQTGNRQPAAIALYENSGWERIPPFGAYADDDIVSVCFRRQLNSAENGHA